MTLLLDAFNVMYKFPQTEEHMYRGDLEKARRALLQLMLDFRNAWKKPMVLHLFFDGKKMPGVPTKREIISGMHVYYSHDLSADHLIKEFIKRSRSPGELRIISSDKDVTLFARKHKAKVQLSEEFAEWVQKLLQPPEVPPPEKSANPKLSGEEVDYWMDMFRSGVDDEGS